MKSDHVDYEIVIGLEVHVELSTKSKIFCSCATTVGGAPNTQVCPICLGMPGTLPVLNGDVVKLAVKAGLGLDCAITPIGRQDRKNYFYPDSPKAYQISQNDLPIAMGGHLDIETTEGLKTEILDGLSVGYYTLKLNANDQAFDYIWYSTSLVYDKTLLETSNKVNVGQSNITLFFPTYDYKNVVPITRPIATPTNRWRSLYTLLASGPKVGLGLYETAPVIPYSPNIRIGSNVANIYLYTKDLTTFDGKFNVITDAITKTFMTLGPLEGVRYWVDDNNTAPFSDFDLSKTYNQSFLNNAFIGYSHDTSHMMLMPMPLKTLTFDDRLREAWALMQFNTDASMVTADMIQSIPDEVALIDYTLETTTLTLNLSGNFQTIYKNGTLYQDLMLKSIWYTAMSFPEVETVKILVDGVPFVSEVYDFTTPLKPDAYINMEP